MVQDAFQHLIDSYLKTKHRKKVDIITRAFNFAQHAHKGVKRLSGEPYIMHPLAVAQIVCSEIGLGSTSICCALLHDVVEDTDYTVEDIENMFGPKIAQIVDGLTKIAGGIFGTHTSSQAENFKKLLLTMNDDIRVILIKMADRLHNMRTLGAQPANKRYKISGETLYIYAPLANRLGLNTIKSELEDLSFKYEHPEEYEAVKRKLEITKSDRLTVFDDFTAPIRAQLDSLGMKYEIKARIKTPYSIWHKMQTKHISFEEVYDILAVRIVFEPQNQTQELEECFAIYAAVSKLYASHPERLRDWVSQPRANGYQALHATMMSNKGEWIEVQIRSSRMDEIAEKGFAAHWKYKEGNNSDTEKESELDKWLVTIQEILDDPQPDAMDFLDTIKLNLFASEIFVFTPKGDIKTLPTGSTALDFAFTIHTVVGSHCMGAKVNHKLVPITHKLVSGDQVEILTSKSLQIKREWLDVAATAKARTRIQTLLRREEKEARKKGEHLFGEFLEEHSMVRDTIVMERLCELHSCKTVDDFFLLLGQEKIKLGNADFLAMKEHPSSNGGFKKLLSFGRKTKKTGKVKSEKHVVDSKSVIILTDDNIGSKYKLADCCNPVSGDDIMGCIEDDGTVTIHKLQCHEAQGVKVKFGNRICEVQWGTEIHHLFLANIQLKGLDKFGLLNRITEVLYKLLNLNIRKLSIESNEGIFDANIQLYVHDVKEINNIVKSLKKIPDIKSVSRV
ncbi:MAG: RelA/SpoT family protein [Bacteroidaceae bacterium]|nr:RelA/SpoT family protein [Bacteroidaceae bacterium]